MSEPTATIDLAAAARNGQALFRKQRFGEAIRLYHQILDQTPDDFDALMALGRMHQLLGVLHKAVHYYRRAAELTPDAWITRYHLGHVLIRIGQYTESAGHLRAVTESGVDGFRNLSRLRAYAELRSTGQDVARFHHHGQEVRFAVDGDNVGLDMFYANSEFFEQAELDYTRDLVPENAVIVDIGANTGNNLVYYAKFMAPKKIYPIEPHPGAIDSLLRNIQLNRIDVVDPGFLGIGVGQDARRMDMTPSQAGDLVTIRLVNGGPGAIEVRPLDGLIDQPIDFLKIDVEGMELAVLLGARQTLSAHCPIIMIEVHNSKDDAFHTLITQLGYYVDRSFDGEGYKNYFLRAR